MEINESIGDRLKKLRQNTKMTQQEVANIIGKSKGNVSGYEKGTFEPSANTIIALANCFKVSTDYILIGTKNKNLVENLTEGERDIVELIHPLSPKEQQRVFGVIENYLSQRKKSTELIIDLPNPLPSIDDGIRELKQEKLLEAFKNTAKPVK